MTESVQRKLTATIIVDIKDEDGIVGRSYCSNCNASVLVSDNYCHKCGARFTETNMRAYKKED